jgi:hypothetical protein
VCLTFAVRKQSLQVLTLTIIAAVFMAARVMDRLGLSSALGAFMVGMILSTSVFAAQIKASVSSLKGLLLGAFFIAIGMSINLKEVVALGGPLLYYLPMSLLIKIILVVALGLGFRRGFRTSILAGLLLAPFDEIAYIIFSSSPISGLLTDRACTIGLIMISFSFVVSPVLINLGYKLAERFPAGPKPPLPLEAMSDSIHTTTSLQFRFHSWIELPTWRFQCRQLRCVPLTGPHSAELHPCLRPDRDVMPWLLYPGAALACHRGNVRRPDRTHGAGNRRCAALHRRQNNGSFTSAGSTGMMLSLICQS